MRFPPFRRVLLHLVLALSGGGFLAAVDAYAMSRVLPGWGAAVFWVTTMAAGWMQCLGAFFGLAVLAGSSRLPGVLMVLGGALLVSLPISLEVRLLIAALEPVSAFNDPIWETAAKAAIIAGFFGTITWSALEGLPLWVPPVRWRNMAALEPAAQVRRPTPQTTPSAAEGALSPSFAAGLPEPDLPPEIPLPPAVHRARAMAPAPLPFADVDSAAETAGSGKSTSGPAMELADAPPDLAAGPRLRRMPEGLEGPILSLRTEDHYLRIHTPSGEGLLLGRLRDAETELEPWEGMRVHRSWWVARAAVERLERDGRRVVLHLVTGQEVPVSRTYQPALKQAGWLD